MTQDHIPQRERMVLEMLVAGKTHKEIGQWWVDRVERGNPGVKLDPVYQGTRLVREARKWESK